MSLKGESRGGSTSIVAVADRGAPAERARARRGKRPRREAANPPPADRRWQGSTADIRALLGQMQALRDAVRATGMALTRTWRPHLLKREYIPSAANLAAYIGLRRHDLRTIQVRLATLGLSSLGRCEGHVMASLDAVIHALKQMTGKRVLKRRITAVASAMTRDEALLRQHTNRLFGPAPASRWIRFMVTLPTEAAADYGFVRDAVKGGMDCARINCAHDAAATWHAMVRNVRRAERETGRACRIIMDLGGPKLRTGAVKAGPPLLRIRVKRDVQGHPVQPARLILDASNRAGAPGPDAGAVPRVAVPRAWLDQLHRGDSVRLIDLRGRERRIAIEKKLSNTAFLASTARGAWIGQDTVLERVPRRGGRAASATCTAGGIAAAPLEIRLEQDDLLLFTREPAPGEPKRVDRRGRTIAPARISCSEPKVFSALKVGHQVWIDDGKIGTVVEALDENGAWLRVTQARPGGERIGPGKGLNFPDSKLQLPALGESDLADLDFAVRHADLIGASFVRTAADLDTLAQALAQRRRPDIGVIAKIETRAAVMNLPEIIIHGAGGRPFGVMVARGDLAVEIGYERMAEIQEEILWLCEAAHVPVIWATQVLEGLVKRGRPSRAEMSDAAMSVRAECVMLNKGPYLVRALSVLDNVTARMQHHQRKKTAQFRALHW